VLVLSDDVALICAMVDRRKEGNERSHHQQLQRTCPGLTQPGKQFHRDPQGLSSHYDYDVDTDIMQWKYVDGVIEPR